MKLIALIGTTALLAGCSVGSLAVKTATTAAGAAVGVGGKVVDVATFLPEDESSVEDVAE